MLDIVQLYEDFSLDYKRAGEHKHARSGFVNVECPFCEGNAGYHLSFHIKNQYFVCWRCGWKGIDYALSGLLNVSFKEAKKIAEEYGAEVVVADQEIKRSNTLPFALPSNIMRLAPAHRDYLIGRNFDPDKLEYEWDIFATGNNSKLILPEMTLDYSARIVIPFIWNGQLVSYDARSIRKKEEVKYQACPLEMEIIPHKNILYGKQSKWKSTGIAVEGPTDVWRFGPSAFATSGIKFTNTQLRTIAKTFKRIPVCFDGGEAQAVIQADALVSELKFRGVDSFRVDIEGDPGAMDQKEADYLVKQLMS